MDRAVERIQQALDNNEFILVYGDYDVDFCGANGHLSESKSKQISTYPDRFDEGYGISHGVSIMQLTIILVLLSHYCKAIDKVQYAKKKGIDFIICDHHLPGENLPAL